MIWDDPIKDICDGKNLYVVAPPQILFVLVTNGNQSIIIIFSLFPELEESIRFVLPFTFYSCLDVLFFFSASLQAKRDLPCYPLPLKTTSALITV